MYKTNDFCCREKYFFGDWAISSLSESKVKRCRLEWHVISEDNNKRLLSLSYGIAIKPYSSSLCKVYWETSDIRNWLNSEFVNNAFNDEERQRILEVEVKNIKDLRNNSPTIYSTKEKVFLLSEQEIQESSLADSAWVRKLMPGLAGECPGAWWLRSYGRLEFYSMGIVRPDGRIYPSGDIRADNVMIVPAIYIRK